MIDILGTILVIAGIIERLTEVIKPIYLKVKIFFTKTNYAECTKTEKIIISEAIGVILCIVAGSALTLPFDNVPAIIQQIGIGLFASLGSNVVHTILNLIVSFKEAAEGINK